MLTRAPHDWIHRNVISLDERYLGTRDSHFAKWLIDRRDNEVAIRIVPSWITAWDYAQRMGS